MIESRLTVCAGNLRQSGIAVMTYSVDNDDYWPLREVITSGTWYCQPIVLEANGVNDRTKLRPYFGTLNILVNPLSHSTYDLDTLTVTSAQFVTQNYELWFGDKWNPADAATGWYRQGQYPTFGGEQFDVLMACFERQEHNAYGSYNNVYGAHPDFNLLEDTSPYPTLAYIAPIFGKIRGHGQGGLLTGISSMKTGMLNRILT